jgi:hypothetical protein
LEALAGTGEILAMLADVVKETAIRRFHVNVPEAELTELSRRGLQIAAAGFFTTEERMRYA